MVIYGFVKVINNMSTSRGELRWLKGQMKIIIRTILILLIYINSN